MIERRDLTSFVARLAAHRCAPLPAIGARRAAVLVPIVASAAGPQLLCFERTELVADHKGEICFPGGSIEHEDRDAIAAALREAYEELGLPPHEVRVLGCLDDVLTHVTNYLITPIVGYLTRLPRLIPDPLEVARPIVVPLAELYAAGAQLEHIARDGVVRDVWSYQVSGGRIWGATARIVRNLLDIWQAEECA